MEGSYGGGETEPTPERRESLYIDSIVIPADERQPLLQNELRAGSLSDRQQLVGGLIQGIYLSEPPACLYCNEEGNPLELPMNKRATLLLWMHNRAFRYRDAIVGDVFVVGPRGKGAVDTSVPTEYITRLVEANRFYVDIRPFGSSDWHRRPERFDDWAAAYGDALRRVGADIRVVPDQ